MVLFSSVSRSCFLTPGNLDLPSDVQISLKYITPNCTWRDSIALFSDKFLELLVCYVAGCSEAVYGSAKLNVDIAIGGDKIHHIVLIDDFLGDVFDVDSHMYSKRCKGVFKYMLEISISINFVPSVETTLFQ